MKIELGEVVITPGVVGLIEKIPECSTQVEQCLNRHANGDWGIVGEDDAQSNNEALEGGERLLSAYMIGATKIWIITEWDRSVTTILLPEEY